jgi:hypothetical protein
MVWNDTHSAIFSGIVSGAVPDQGLMRSNGKGPDVLTGGNFGLETSVIAFALCAATGVVLVITAVRHGKIVPPPGKPGA